ncbi:hypothetical protein BaRGS_00021935 [Batillaria attramentaria]|uniref:Uncharacterized protein n=1 Tax=Batillaria attramentaria TaxID=370345 RepID=A0ABD0KHS1_9CAEN
MLKNKNNYATKCLAFYFVASTNRKPSGKKLQSIANIDTSMYGSIRLGPKTLALVALPLVHCECGDTETLRKLPSHDYVPVMSLVVCTCCSIKMGLERPGAEVASTCMCENASRPCR